MKTRTFAEIDAWCVLHRDKHDYALMVAEMVDDDDGIASAYYLSEMNDLTREALAGRGMTWDDDGVTYWNLDAVDEYAANVVRVYDEGDDDAWEDLGCLGDDDVDYNGGYISTFTEILREMDK